ncbi:hypothetical protein DPMN_191629 [Dreissena polymorpha]|uniref:Uncharacterized protein n=1 Tax=Dreissena polymorpha TaxID=45954 RepID=A0A9D3Y5D9_DREPO|nr:hypothetical protein DPMN_191629 [Dreissena polymorpha]
MSSFGSTFGKPNEKLLPKPSPKHVARKSDIDIKPYSEEMNMAIGSQILLLDSQMLNLFHQLKINCRLLRKVWMIYKIILQVL